MSDLNAIGLTPSPPHAPRVPRGDAGYVEDSDEKVRSPVETDSLERQAEQLTRTHHGSGQSAVKLDTSSGRLDLVAEVRAQPLPRAEKVLPLRLGALRRSLQEIAECDPWLMSRRPVFYIKEGKAHIDFTDLAGFVVDPMGHITSRSVSPW